MREPREHELKTWPSFFAAVVDGSKTFEFRHNDRDFAVGDVLCLREWSQSEGYSGRQTRRAITYVLQGRLGMLDRYAVLGIAPTEYRDAKEKAMSLKSAIQAAKEWILFRSNLGAIERIEAKLDALLRLTHELAVEADRHHHAGGFERSRSSIGVTLLIDRRSFTVDPITLPEHKTFSDRKTQLLFAPTYLDPNDTSAGPDGTPKPDPDAVVNVISSDPSQVGVEKDDQGRTFITTPAESGAATITISASSPNASYADTILPYSYVAPIPGQLNVSIGSDVRDA